MGLVVAVGRLRGRIRQRRRRGRVSSHRRWRP